jgi:hypothetical protein
MEVKIMEAWELVELPEDLEIDVDMFDFACCGGICGGGTV